jgi:hypothetical protein
MPNYALRSRIVNLEKDTGMSGVHEEDLEFGQNESEAVMNLVLDEVRVEQ